MKICMIGTGYVGLVSGTCFAETGHDVVCIDINQEKIKQLQSGVIPIYEPGLSEMIARNMQAERLRFSTDLKQAVNDSLFVFIAVGTPTLNDGSSDLTSIFNVAEKLGEYINDYKIIVTKSTVPVGTTEKVKKFIYDGMRARGVTIDFDIVNNPEFLKEGDAIKDFLRPDRIVIGVENDQSADLMKDLYASFVRNGHQIYTFSIASSELTKYASNAMLATRISFMNELSLLCDKIGADIEEIRKGIGSDSRIGMSFLYAGLGYGGSCFPKDIKALSKTMQDHDIDPQILHSVESINKNQRKYFSDKILKHHAYNLHDKRVCIWGLSFKPNTDDLRDAPSVDIISSLLEHGAHCVCFCPEGIPNAKKHILHHNIEFINDMYAACQDADFIVLVTEWPQFRYPDWKKINQLVRHKEFWDGRNQYDPVQRMQDGWQYFCIGRVGCGL